MEINENSTGGYTGKEIARYALDYFFPIVDVGNFKLEDEIFCHEPESENQADVRGKLIDIIRAGQPSFRAMAMLPSCDRTQILFGRGLMPKRIIIINQFGDSWDCNKTVKEYLLEYGSDIGTLKQWYSFLGQLIYDFFNHFVSKEGLEIEKALSKAWHVVCDDTTEYANMGTGIPESCGRKIFDDFRWYDLGNKERVIYDHNRPDGMHFVKVGASFEKNPYHKIDFAIGNKPHNYHYIVSDDNCYQTEISLNPLPWIVLNAPILK